MSVPFEERMGTCALGSKSGPCVRFLSDMRTLIFDGDIPVQRCFSSHLFLEKSGHAKLRYDVGSETLEEYSRELPTPL